MDFLTTDFSKLFLEKHKQDIFNKVCTIIEKERKQQCDNQYIELIFKIALFDFLGLSNTNIQKILYDLELAQNIDILKIKQIHKESLSEIKKYLKQNENEFKQK